MKQILGKCRLSEINILIVISISKGSIKRELQKLNYVIVGLFGFLSILV